jgi:ribosomal-protein-alanine N-acetyltransferase
MSMPHEIHTKRLLLRPPGEADAQRMFERYCNDPEVCRYLSWAPHRHVRETANFLQTTLAGITDGTRAARLIFDRESGELLGSVGGVLLEHRLQFGYCLARDAWGQGYATEASRAFVAVAMNEPNVWRVQAFCDIENRASARVLEKAGLNFEGTLKRYMVMPNVSGEPRDMHCYAKVR